MPDGPVGRARAALSRGDALAAFDEAVSAVEADPTDLEARFVAALALARSGAVERAGTAAAELSAQVDAATDIEVWLREDAAALVARLAKDEALAAAGPERDVGLRRAATLYEQVADRFGRFFTCINAATLWLLAGERDRARELASRARALTDAEARIEPIDDYWREATVAEASLILGEVDDARQALDRAVKIANDDFAAQAITRRQLRLVCEATGTDIGVLDALSAPLVVCYSGHLIDGDDGAGRFPAEMEPDTALAIRDYVAARRIGFGYGALASGADILSAEAFLDAGVRLHVVLPFDTDEFEQVSVLPAGPRWTERFRSCLARASSVVHASDSAFMHDEELFRYAARIAMGHALNRAAYLDAPAEQLAIWDQDRTRDEAGTAHDVAVWSATGHPTHHIALPRVQPRSHSAPPPSGAASRAIGAILFSDLHGFSRLRDEHFSGFINHVLADLGAVLDRCGDALLWRNSWGDAIAAVFADVNTAADCALGLQEASERLDLAALGLPPNLDLRIGCHAGPVMAITDPLTHLPMYWGRELTRAARIEPRTPEGEVYVTDAFAALLALEPEARFATEYVGQITTAKDFETIPMYRLRRSRPNSAGEAR